MVGTITSVLEFIFEFYLFLPEQQIRSRVQVNEIMSHDHTRVQTSIALC